MLTEVVAGFLRGLGENGVRGVGERLWRRHTGGLLSDVKKIPLEWNGGSIMGIPKCEKFDQMFGVRGKMVFREVEERCRRGHTGGLCWDHAVHGYAR